MGRDASWLHARIGRTVTIDNGQRDCDWQLVAVRGTEAVFENSDEPDLLVPHAEARAMLEETERVCLDCGRDVETECRCRNIDDRG